jgi:Amt family ammonium transporter
LKGLFYGGGLTLFKAQFIGSATITIATFAVSMLVMYAVNALGLLRVSAEGELYGLDLHEHGISAYPEYVITTLGTPSGAHTTDKTSVYPEYAIPARHTPPAAQLTSDN